MVVAIVGPTAVGKSSLALKIASRMDGEIVSADSAQVYRHLNIGTAKPSLSEQKKVKHHLIDIIDPDVQFSVAHYQKLAFKVIPEILSAGKRPIIVGGTGLYIRSITDAYVFSSSGRNRKLREELNRIAREKGSEYLHRQLVRDDPQSAMKIHPRDKRRIIRALEVYRGEGRRISKQWQETGKQTPRYHFIVIGLTRDREDLYRRINRRTDEMMENGFVREVKNLMLRYPKDAPGLQVMGYRQLANYLEGRLSLKETTEIIKKETRNYAKRQLTWFRRDERIRWFDTRGIDIEKLVENINT
ncbi:MAG: tRNA (adenosine(37)-N6)-dimethylallyltransferase MiaA [Firmicutes bacterium]|nr:tRNA (adenosine(37)-N6)-dimethylallyltransferase MiaA [Bacillota bacterium]